MIARFQECLSGLCVVTYRAASIRIAKIRIKKAGPLGTCKDPRSAGAPRVLQNPRPSNVNGRRLQAASTKQHQHFRLIDAYSLESRPPRNQLTHKGAPLILTPHYVFNRNQRGAFPSSVSTSERRGQRYPHRGLKHQLRRQDRGHSLSRRASCTMGTLFFPSIHRFLN